MGKPRFTDSQIIGMLNQAENGIPIPEICRENGVSTECFINRDPSMVGWILP